jgi:hypothetical protein
MWAAVFGVLGWNFMNLGLFSPPAHHGTSVSWISCGVVFWLMALPAIPMALSRPLAWVRRGGGPPPSATAATAAQLGLQPVVRAARPPGQ